MHVLKISTRRTCGALLSALLCVAIWGTQANGGEPVYRCEEHSQTLTLYESTTSRLFEYELALSGPGTFDITLETDDFAFEGYSYARTGTWSKWHLLQKSRKGLHSWTSRIQVNQNEVQYARLQLISSQPTCRMCTAKVTLNTSGCINETLGQVTASPK